MDGGYAAPPAGYSYRVLKLHPKEDISVGERSGGGGRDFEGPGGEGRGGQGRRGGGRRDPTGGPGGRGGSGGGRRERWDDLMDQRAEFRERLNDRFDRLDDRMDKIEERIERLERRR
jgi:hypothetical protein